MDKLFSLSYDSLAKTVISCVLIYTAVIIFTRIFGKRSFSKMSSFDFALTVAIGSIVATTILSSTLSIFNGVVGLLIVYILQFVVGFLRRFRFFSRAIDNSPLLLMDGSNILYNNLKKARVTEGDLRSKLRESNIYQLSQVKAAIFETTGDITVLHSSENRTEVEVWILKDVNI